MLQSSMVILIYCMIAKVLCYTLKETNRLTRSPATAEIISSKMNPPLFSKWRNRQWRWLSSSRKTWAFSKQRGVFGVIVVFQVMKPFFFFFGSDLVSVLFGGCLVFVLSFNKVWAMAILLPCFQKKKKMNPPWEEVTNRSPQREPGLLR